MIIKHHARRGRWSELDQLTVDDLVNNPPYVPNNNL
jgi:methylase of polypeptide subunit release factors